MCDIVAVSKAKHIYDKAYRPNWVTEPFKIIKVDITYPVTNTLEDSEVIQILISFTRLSCTKLQLLMCI